MYDAELSRATAASASATAVAAELIASLYGWSSFGGKVSQAPI